MTTRNIDDQLRQYYAAVGLERASLERLRGVVTKTAGEPEAKRGELRAAGAWRLVAIAASISIVFLAAAVLLLRSPDVEVTRIAEQGLSERIASEVARRHGRCVEEIDFRADDLQRLLSQMEKVDFLPAVPSKGGLSSMKVKGAHYCVLDGQIAIHAVLVDDSGAIVSLFETKAGEEIVSLRAASQRIAQTDVELWQEQGVLFAAAVSAPTT